MAYTIYTLREALWGLGYMAPGETLSSHDEGECLTAIGRILGANAQALGVGIYAGGDASISGGNVAITAVVAMVEDDDGCVPIGAAASSVLNTAIANGTSYIHLQGDEEARADGSCGYYVSSSATPAPGAVLVCKVTRAAGVITAVDNSVRQSPAIAARIPWAELVREYGGTDNLETTLTAILGTDYLGATPPADVDTRLTALEAGEGGGGGGSTEYWGDLDQESPGVSKTIRQGAAEEAEIVAEAEVSAHVTLYHGTTGGGEGGGTGTEQWDSVAINELRGAAATAHYLPTVVETMVDACVVVDGHCGDEYIDVENSTF